MSFAIMSDGLAARQKAITLCFLLLNVFLVAPLAAVAQVDVVSKDEIKTSTSSADVKTLRQNSTTTAVDASTGELGMPLIFRKELMAPYSHKRRANDKYAIPDFLNLKDLKQPVPVGYPSRNSRKSADRYITNSERSYE